MSAAAPRPVRHFVMPATLGGKLHAWRFLIARRLVQGGVLLLFFGTAAWGWKLAGAPLLAGNLSAATLAGAVPLVDPFALLQMLAAGRVPEGTAIGGALLVLAAYLVAGGRAFCAWACPMNLVTDAAHAVRERVGGRDLVNLSPALRYWALALALVLSAIAGFAAFEWVSPIAMLHRELLFGAGLGLTAAGAIFLFDAFVLRRGWCGHLCPLGAFWSVAGRAGVTKVAFDDAACTRCGDCVRACPEPRVFDFKDCAARGFVAAGECTNCGECVAVCPEKALRFDLRARARARRATEPVPTEGIAP